MAKEQMLAGMQQLQEMKDAAEKVGRQWAYAAVAKDGHAILIYANGEIDGFDVGVVMNRIESLRHQSWNDGFAAAASPTNSPTALSSGL